MKISIDDSNDDDDDDDDDDDHHNHVKQYKGTQAKNICKREEQKQHRLPTSPTDKTKTHYHVP